MEIYKSWPKVLNNWNDIKHFDSKYSRIISLLMGLLVAFNSATKLISFSNTIII